MDFPVLSLIILLPAVGVVPLLFLTNARSIRWIALVFTVADFLLTILLLVLFQQTSHQMQFAETLEWVPALGIAYRVGVDGISVLFVFLTALLGWICVLASWNAITMKLKEFMICILIMQSLMIGVFCALDLFLFYVLWEAMLIPMYLLIGIWGGPNRVYAAFKFFLYTLAGSLLFLIGIIVLYIEGNQSFDILMLMSQDYGFEVQFWVFLAFLVAFAG